MWQTVNLIVLDFHLHKKMVNTTKIVFNKTITTIAGSNTRLENGDLVTIGNYLKNKSGKDIIVSVGANFVSSKIKNNFGIIFMSGCSLIQIGFANSTYQNRKDAPIHKSGVVSNVWIEMYKDFVECLI